MGDTTLPIEVGDDALLIGGEPVPLFSGEMHFWRIAPEHWETCLRRLKELGLHIVATYLSWRRHSPTPKETDLTGRTDPHLDVPGFLELCQSLGLWVHLKPGPWICAEETNGGYPDWLLEETELLARDAQGRVVLGNDPPLQHPLPSYLHPRYLAYVKRWIQEVSCCIRPFCFPDGPIVMIQLDNEPSMAFHDGMFEADYHPVVDGSSGLYPQWLQEKYGAVERLNDAHMTSTHRFYQARAPRSLELTHLGELARLTDWAEFKEWLLTKHIETLRQMYLKNGVDQVLFTVNFVEGDRLEGEPLAVPNDWHRLQAVSGLGGLDYYAFPPFDEAALIRVVKGVNYSRSVCRMVWAPEMMAGLWLDDAPYVPDEDALARLTEQLQLTALAYGLKGLNFYMLVNRELWAYAPIDERGQPTLAYARAKRVLELAQRLRNFRKSQPLAVMYYRPYAREAYVVAGTGLEVDGVRLGASWARFEALYAGLVRFNYDPAIFDPHVNGTDIARYKAILIPSGLFWDVDAQNLLVDYAAAGGRLILWGDLTNFDADLRPCSLVEPFLNGALEEEARSVFRARQFGDGEILFVRPDVSKTGKNSSKRVEPEILKAVLRHCQITPEVEMDVPGVFTIVQRNGWEAVLFVINIDSAPCEVTLRWRGAGNGSLRRIFPAGAEVALCNGEARATIQNSAVEVFYREPAS
jgi:hypothetical protein